MSGRADSFALLKEPTAFAAKPKPEKRVEEAAIADIAQQEIFQFAKPKTGRAVQAQATSLPDRRNRHSGIKGDRRDTRRVLQGCDDCNVPLGELLRLALDALERAGASPEISTSS